MSQETQHKLAQQEAMSDLKGTVMHAWSKFANFSAKFHFCKQPGRRNCTADRQIVTFSAWQRKVPLSFWATVCFTLKTPRTTQLLTSTPKKALRHALHCPFYSTLDLNHFIYRKLGNFRYMRFSLEKFSCWKIFVGSTAYKNILTRKFLQRNQLSRST